MPEQEYADIIPLLRNLCLALQLLAGNRHIRINLPSVEKKIQFFTLLNDLISDFSKLIITVIDYVPDNNTIALEISQLSKIYF